MCKKPQLRNRAQSGLIWGAAERFSQQGFYFVVQLVLARLLAPEEFGLIAMASVFTVICFTLVDCGFGRALIQKDYISEADRSTTFYFNLLAASLISFTLFACAPVIANFYEEPVLVSVVRWLSLSLIFGSIGLVHFSLLTRSLKFKELFKATLPATLISGLVGVVMALYGWGVWALVGQVLIDRLLRSILVWLISDWTPSLLFKWSSLRSMFPYASQLALSSILDQGFRNIYVLVIGKFFTLAEVGFFHRARAFQQLPVSNFQSVLSQVAFPLFASIQNDPARMRSGMRKALQLGALFSFPTMTGMALVAEPMVVVIIGEQWLPIVPILQLLCVVGVIYPISAINVNLLMSIGRADLFLRIEIIKKLLVLANVLITYRYGLTAMILGMIVVSIIALVINTFYSKVFLGYGLFKQLKDIFAIAVIVLIMSGGVLLFSNAVEFKFLPKLLLEVILGIGLFVVLLRFLPLELKEEIVRITDPLPGWRFSRSILLL